LSIGTKIKELRKSKKLTQKELAKKINKSERVLQKYESGEIIPSFTVIEDIAAALDVSYLSLMIETVANPEKEDFFEETKKAWETLHTNKIKLTMLDHPDITNPVPFSEVLTPDKADELLNKILDQRDIGRLLQDEKPIYYNRHALSEYERKRVLAMLRIMFLQEGELE